MPIFLVFAFFLFPTLSLAQKRIEVDLTHQQLLAYNDQTLIYSFLISSGRWNLTPNGRFSLYYKTPSIRMTGGDKLKGDFYDLPNVPYDMFFLKDMPYTEPIGIPTLATRCRMDVSI